MMYQWCNQPIYAYSDFLSGLKAPKPNSIALPPFILISALHPNTTFLVVKQVVVSHEDPVMVEGGGCPTGVEDTGVVS